MSKRGFSVIELIVSVAIFTGITGLLLANYGQFSGTTVINSLAYEVALAVRQAQVFGIGVQEFGVGTGVFPSYGIHYANTDNTTLRLFADSVTENKKYDDGELVEQFTLRQGNTISRVCGYSTAGAECTEMSELNVTFTRPNPEAMIIGIPDNGQYSYARITLSSPRGLTKDVLVWANGQVSVE